MKIVNSPIDASKAGDGKIQLQQEAQPGQGLS